MPRSCCWFCSASWKRNRYFQLAGWEFPGVHLVPVGARCSGRSLMHRFSISQKPASRGSGNTCWLLARAACLLDFTHFMGYGRPSIFRLRWDDIEDIYQNFSDLFHSLFSGKGSCLYIEKKCSFIYVISPRHAQKPKDDLPKCSPFHNLVSLT